MAGQAEVLWAKYYMLTQEILKFVNWGDIDEFNALVAQRKQLMDLIQKDNDIAYRATPKAQELFAKIKPLDMQALYKAKAWLNKARRQNMAVKSYDAESQMPSGHHFNLDL